MPKLVPSDCTRYHDLKILGLLGEQILCPMILKGGSLGDMNNKWYWQASHLHYLGHTNFLLFNLHFFAS
jgi:hypothetical protein